MLFFSTRILVFNTENLCFRTVLFFGNWNAISRAVLTLRGGLFWGLSDLHKFHKGSATIKKSFGLQAGLEVAALGKQQVIRERPCRIYIYIYIYTHLVFFRTW